MSLTPYYISMVFINVMWGLSFIASKHAMNVGFTPMLLALWRYILTAAVLVPAVIAKEKRLRIEKRDILPMILSSLFGIKLYYFFEYQGIKQAKPPSQATCWWWAPALSGLAISMSAANCGTGIPAFP